MEESLDIKNRHYQSVAEAIRYIRDNANTQPSLSAIAAAVNMSEYHFQRIFSQWAGISPKRYLQYLTKEAAKQQLQQSADLLTTALSSGLSGPGRLHELMISCEGMSPGEIKSGGKGMDIHYGEMPTPFGKAIAGWTERGVCYLHFISDNTAAEALSQRWPAARLIQDEKGAIELGKKIFIPDEKPQQLHLLLRGTNFQLKVWEALLAVPAGHIVSYATLAGLAGCPGSQRAVGTALAKNDIGVLIPCHRVIKSSGECGQYRWGEERKQAMIALEHAQATAA
ncbi:MAG: bifunctional transcriptional activator/DNA repair enzyme AdaA [Thiolinea sp.]